MLKKMIFAAAATAFVAAFSLPMQPAPATAAVVTCKQAAKMKFPKDLKARLNFRKECKAAWKAHQKA
jgi:hypothetical protein